MSDPLLPQDDRETPLSDEEHEGLKLPYVATRRDLNAAEQQNILKAQAWAARRKNEVLSRDYLNDLHKRMYGDVWTWAGTYRKTEKTSALTRSAYQPSCRNWSTALATG